VKFLLPINKLLPSRLLNHGSKDFARGSDRFPRCFVVVLLHTGGLRGTARLRKV